MKQRKIPMRKCIGCQESFPKNSLCRIVKTKIKSDNPESDENEEKDIVKFDASGKLNGRGAYICKNMDCFEKAVKSKRLSRTLEIEIPSVIYDEIKAEILKIEKVEKVEKE
jgi:predicted RNA-binding protein YlxR (DUF448 family)